MKSNRVPKNSVGVIGVGVESAWPGINNVDRGVPVACSS